MLTGALAVSYYGEPRTTHDIDVVIAVSAADIARISAALAPDSFLREESIRAALREASVFDVVHRETGLKVDFLILKSDNYS